MIDEMIRRTVLIESLKSHYAKDFEPFVKQIDELLRLELTDKELSQMSARQLNEWLRNNKDKIAEILAEFADVTLVNVTEFVADEIVFTAKVLGGITATKAIVPKIPKNNYLDVPLPTGQLADEVLKKFTTDESERIINAVRRGVFEGKTNSQILQVVRGTRKNRFNDGIISTSTRNANAIVRTLIAHSATEARMAVGKANSDILEDKVRILATLDSRTSSICRAKDWQEFPFERQYLPPFHINCRSTWVFIVKDKGTGVDKRASQNGMVKAQSYYDWLKTQPKDFQDEVLGKSRAEIFRSGGMTAEQFRNLQLDKNFKPRTLKEIQEILNRRS